MGSRESSFSMYQNQLDFRNRFLKQLSRAAGSCYRSPTSTPNAGVSPTLPVPSLVLSSPRSWVATGLRRLDTVKVWATRRVSKVRSSTNLQTLVRGPRRTCRVLSESYIRSKFCNHRCSVNWYIRLQASAMMLGMRALCGTSKWCVALLELSVSGHRNV